MTARLCSRQRKTGGIDRPYSLNYRELSTFVQPDLPHAGYETITRSPSVLAVTLQVGVQETVFGCSTYDQSQLDIRREPE